MNRRQMLAGVGATVASVAAGCLAADGDPDDGTGDGGAGGTGDDGTGDDAGDDDTGGGTDDGTGDVPERRVAVTAVDTVPEQVPVAFDVAVTDDEVSADGTAAIEVAATNTGDTRREVNTPYYKGASEDGSGLLLYSLSAPDSPSREDAPTCGSAEAVEWTMEGPVTHTLDPGESGRDELVVVDDPSVDGCFPTGDHRFERGHSIDGTEFTWGFTLELGEPPAEPANRRYEECRREVIPYDQFPADVRSEIDAALDGRYEADRVFLREAMDTDESFVSVDDEYYEPTVLVVDGTERLSLRHVEPKALPSARPVSVELDRDDDRTVSLELVADDGTVLLERSQDVQPYATVEFGHTARVGTHDLRVTVVDGGTVEREVTKPVTISESQFEVIAVVDPNGVTVTGAVAELGVCQYEI